MIKPSEIWARYAITIETKSNLIGGIPAKENLINGWITKNMPAIQEAEKEKLIKATLEELGPLSEEVAESTWTKFKVDTKGVYIECRQLKSAFKEASNILRELLQKNEGKGKKNSDFTRLRAKVAERLFVEGNRCYPTRNGKVFSAPEGVEERPIHIMTAQGPRSALKRFDLFQPGIQLSFTIRTLNDGLVSKELLEVFMEYMSFNGIGADRSQGAGQFTLISVEPLAIDERLPPVKDAPNLPSAAPMAAMPNGHQVQAASPSA